MMDRVSINVIPPINSSTNSQKQPVQNTRPQMDLKELLKTEFDIEFPISGGINNGNSHENPIKIYKQENNNYISVEHEVLSCLGIGKQINWSTIKRNTLQHDGHILDQVRIEIKRVTETEIITQFENYYFDITEFCDDFANLSGAASGFFDDQTNTFFPMELGFLKQGVVTNNKDSRLGVSIDYKALGATATVYLYSGDYRDIGTGTDSVAVKHEFISAISTIFNLGTYINIKRTEPQVVELQAHKDSLKLLQTLFEFQEKNKTETLMSWLFITGYRGHILKIRFTGAKVIFEDPSIKEFLLNRFITSLGLVLSHSVN